MFLRTTAFSSNFLTPGQFVNQQFYISVAVTKTVTLLSLLAFSFFLTFQVII